MSNPNARITVAECFGPTLQGEGAVTGQFTVFVRTGGCDFSCVWCLAPETMVEFSDGREKQISELVVGDVLTGFDVTTQSLKETIVTAILAHPSSDLYTLTVMNDASQRAETICSGDHQWLLIEDATFVNTRDLVKGMRLTASTVVSVKPYTGANIPLMYDIECQPYPTFYANSMVTHNCDSLHAVLPEFAKNWTKYTPEELKLEVEKYSHGLPMNITLSGGNPALQPFGDFIDLMHKEGYNFTMETQGSVVQDWFSKLDYLVLSPKPPSSHMVNDFDVVQACIDKAYELNHAEVSIKVVVMDEEDYQFAKQVQARFDGVPFYISVGNINPPIVSDKKQFGSGEFNPLTITESAEWLIKRLTEDGKTWKKLPRVTVQVHTMLWANKSQV